MKIYEIFDDENKISIGVLLYYEKQRSFIIELQDNLDEWSAPLLLTNFVKKGIYTIPKEISFMWVQERIIPSGRQNIGDILIRYKLKSYDEMKLLELSEGRCSQDNLFIRKIDELPDYVIARQKKTVVECLIRENNTILCFFADESVRKVDLSKIVEVEGVEKIIANEVLFQSGKVGTGGYSVVFNDSIDIPAAVLYESGVKIPIKLSDFIAFIRKNVYDTTESCYMLECSRQNISYLVKQQQLSPVKEEVKGNLYLKGDIINNQW